MNTEPEPAPAADVSARRRGGRPSLDPARRRGCPLTVNVDELTARRAWALAAHHPQGISGLLRDALAAALDAAEAGR